MLSVEKQVECDACGKKYKIFTGFEGVSIINRSRIYTLCRECTDKVRKFIGSLGKEECTCQEINKKVMEECKKCEECLHFKGQKCVCDCHSPKKKEELCILPKTKEQMACSWYDRCGKCEGCRLFSQQKKEDDTPMGVTQWRNHGKKYGYWDFWFEEKKQDIDLPEEIEEIEWIKQGSVIPSVDGHSLKIDQGCEMAEKINQLIRSHNK